MATIVLKWNPAKWNWADMPQRLAEIARDGATVDTWYCGNAKKIEVGDRAFLLRVGREPRGIVGVGTISRAPFEGPHWDSERSALGETAHFVEVRFEQLDGAPSISAQELAETPFKSISWFTQSPIIYLPDEVSAAIIDRL